jgi:hypothetical protein
LGPLIKAISFIKATGKCEKQAIITVIVFNGFIYHSSAVDGMAAGEDENEMDGAAKADDALSQTKNKRNKKCLRGHTRVF